MILSAEEYSALGFEGGEDTAECERAVGRAERIIDLLTGGLVSESGIPEDKLKYLKQAVGAQAELYLLNGAQPAQGKITIGDFSYTAENDGESPVSPLAMTVLKLSGLYYRGVEGRR